ncbi:hypothetical protein A2U01_0086184, partial [Trifolium medium]|nr:hypothetical protein [Trifolium medium]
EQQQHGGELDFRRPKIEQTETTTKTKSTYIYVGAEPGPIGGAEGRAAHHIAGGISYILKARFGYGEGAARFGLVRRQREEV